MKCPLCSSAQRESWLTGKNPPYQYWSCTECKLIWLDEQWRPIAKEELARYQTHQNDPSDEKYMAYLSRVAFPVMERVEPGARGLDFGCGPTEGMKALLSGRGFSVESYDPFFFPRAELLNFRYDFVLCSEAAEHFFDPAGEFSRIAQLVRPGGWLGVSSELAPEELSSFDSWWYRRDPTHVVFYREKTVQWIAQQGGWELVKLQSPLWFLKKNYSDSGGRNRL